MRAHPPLTPEQQAHLDRFGPAPREVDPTGYTYIPRNGPPVDENGNPLADPGAGEHPAAEPPPPPGPLELIAADLIRFTAELRRLSFDPETGGPITGLQAMAGRRTVTRLNAILADLAARIAQNPPRPHQHSFDLRPLPTGPMYTLHECRHVLHNAQHALTWLQQRHAAAARRAREGW